MCLMQICGQRKINVLLVLDPNPKGITQYPKHLEYMFPEADFLALSLQTLFAMWVPHSQLWTLKPTSLALSTPLHPTAGLGL